MAPWQVSAKVEVPRASRFAIQALTPATIQALTPSTAMHLTVDGGGSVADTLHRVRERMGVEEDGSSEGRIARLRLCSEHPGR